MLAEKPKKHEIKKLLHPIFPFLFPLPFPSLPFPFPITITITINPLVILRIQT
jgi:hypothetical protein